MLKALVAMSGGVDSAAAAYLMQKRGYEVCGVTLVLSEGSAAEAKNAEAVAKQLSAKHITLDMSAEFSQLIIEPFINCYCSGKTPNPCVLCNKQIKFGLLYDKARELGFDVFATGHYARLSWDGSCGEPRLFKAADAAKDQSYVLYSVEASRFRNIVFPLGEMNKPQVRELAQSIGLCNSEKSDSQDICFIPDGDHAGFIERSRGKAPEGSFTDGAGNVLGRHRGITAYTVGQRRGLGVAAAEPYYVLEKNAEKNFVVLGFERELMTDTFRIGDVNILCPSFCTDRVECNVRTRYHQCETPCTVDFDRGIVALHEKIRKPAAGQSAVFYKNDLVLGGGIIL